MTELAPDSLSRRRRHREMLVVATVVVVLSFMLQIVVGEQVAFRWLPQHPLPPSCFFRSLFDASCPGCGLTRSFILLAQGDFAASFRMHHLGWLMALVVLLQFPYRLASLWWKYRHILNPRVARFISHALIFLLLANWCVGLMAYR
jgi:hypothetical protein